ncbi:hypothetical protein LLG95_07010 [bacterium]|nr:hypothetical protein [bacterium]
MVLNRKTRYWLALAVCAVLYGLFWKFKFPVGKRGTGFNFIANLSMLWLITATFLYIQTNWNGHRLLRHCTDEIRVLPGYRVLIADALYPTEYIHGLDYFFIFSALCMLFVEQLCLIPYLIWGTAAYHAIIGMDIELRLDLAPRRRVLVNQVIWAAIPVWIPIFLYIARDVFNLLGRSHIQALELWSNFLYTATVAAAICLPVYGAFKIYRRGLGELDKLNYTAPFWPRKNEF